MHRARKKMSRREIKQDPLLIWTSRVSMFINENLWPILGGVAAFVLLVVGFWMYGGWSDRKDQRGMENVAALSQIAQSGDYDLTVSEADRVIAQYGGHAELLAKLYKADALREQGNYDAAGPIYKDLTGAFSSDNEVFSYRATKGYADVLGAQSNYADAASMLSRWAGHHAESGLAPHALMDAAVCYELGGQYAEAESALQQIINDYADSQVVGQARRRLKLMEGAVAVSR